MPWPLPWSPIPLLPKMLHECKDFLRSLTTDEWVQGDLWADAIEVLEARIATLEDAIREVLTDEESQDGGWGPDVTMRAVLNDALNEPGDNYEETER